MAREGYMKVWGEIMCNLIWKVEQAILTFQYFFFFILVVMKEKRGRRGWGERGLMYDLDIPAAL